MRRTAAALLWAAVVCLCSLGPLLGTPTAAAADSGPGVWRRADLTLQRGSWQQVGTRSVGAGETWTVSLQLTLDLDSATGSAIRGGDTSIGWTRLGWGQPSVAGGDDLAGTSVHAIAVDDDAGYQHLAQHTLAGGGPLAWWVKVGGDGAVKATLLVFQAIRGAPAAGCPPLIPACLVYDLVGGAAEVGAGAVGGMVESAAETMLGVVATGFLEAYLIMFRWATTWWLNLTMSPQALVGAVDSDFRSTISYIAAFVMVIALLSAAMQTMWRRDGSVVADTASGVFKAVLTIFGAWAVLGTLWTLADRLTAALAPDPANIDVGPVAALATTAAGPGAFLLVILLSGIGFVLSLGMALMMVFRLASTVVLALLLPIAAGGAPGTSTRAWLPKVTGWILALVFLRPMVAAIYRIGFEFIAGGNDPANSALVAQMGASGQDGALPDAVADGLMTMLVGAMTLLVAMFALPVLLRLFTWMFGAIAGGGGAALAAASLGTQTALLARRGGGAAQHAARMGADLDNQNGGGHGGPPPGSAGPGGPPGAGVGGGAPTPGGAPGAPSPAGGTTTGAGPGAGGTAAGGSAAGGASASASVGAGAAAAGCGTAAGAGAGAAAGAAAGAPAGPIGVAAGAAVVGGTMQLASAARKAGARAGQIADGGMA